MIKTVKLSFSNGWGPFFFVSGVPNLGFFVEKDGWCSTLGRLDFWSVSLGTSNAGSLAWMDGGKLGVVFVGLDS